MMHWAYYTDLAIAANFAVPPGGEHSTFAPAVAALNHMPIQNWNYFSIDVYTDDLVDCPAVLQHNTVYNLAPPFNKDGFLVVTGHLMRLQIRNVSGNVVSPFNLVAKVWN
jgi:hypothetical protein